MNMTRDAIVILMFTRRKGLRCPSDQISALMQLTKDTKKMPIRKVRLKSGKKNQGAQILLVPNKT